MEDFVFLFYYLSSILLNIVLHLEQISHTRELHDVFYYHYVGHIHFKCDLVFANFNFNSYLNNYASTLQFNIHVISLQLTALSLDILRGN